ncbi:hypothetical protein G6F42_016741 [Rhizopus arrhizus]|nr:hypothetical protein G6F42_016741 [Rhizopus arrhizus]
MADFGRDVAKAGEPVYIWTYSGLATCACRLCKNNISTIPRHQDLNEHIFWNDLMFTRCLKIYEHILISLEVMSCVLSGLLCLKDTTIV